MLFQQPQKRLANQVPNEHQCVNVFAWRALVERGTKLKSNFNLFYIDKGSTRTRFTASSQAFFSSMALAVLTLITSRSCDEITDRGPTGRSDSGLGVLRVGVLFMAEPSVSDCCWAGFFERAILAFTILYYSWKPCRVPLYLYLYIYIHVSSFKVWYDYKK
jgi:hypothetical protein